METILDVPWDDHSYIANCDDRSEVRLWPRHRVSYSLSFPILQTCRKLRSEGLTVFECENKFAHVSGADNDLREFLRNVGLDTIWFGRPIPNVSEMHTVIKFDIGYGQGDWLVNETELPSLVRALKFWYTYSFDQHEDLEAPPLNVKVCGDSPLDISIGASLVKTTSHRIFVGFVYPWLVEYIWRVKRFKLSLRSREYPDTDSFLFDLCQQKPTDELRAQRSSASFEMKYSVITFKLGVAQEWARRENPELMSVALWVRSLAVDLIHVQKSLGAEFDDEEVVLSGQTAGLASFWMARCQLLRIYSDSDLKLRQRRAKIDILIALRCPTPFLPREWRGVILANILFVELNSPDQPDPYIISRAVHGLFVSTARRTPGYVERVNKQAESAIDICTRAAGHGETDKRVADLLFVTFLG